ncbi:hypothetical protein Plhal304r1_c001g0000041 [Plasmopara halstedii]
MMTNSSDAETVLGEDSPLSPCMWEYSSHSEDGQQLVGRTKMAPCSSQIPASRNGDSPIQGNTRRELQLSPASQLDVLSHISELADAHSRQTSLDPIRHAQCTHVWAPAINTTKRKMSATNITGVSAKKVKRQNIGTVRPLHSQAERLRNDMMDWETCSEGDLLMVDSEDEEKHWVYFDISDSDYDA